MAASFTISQQFSASAKRLFEAWLDSEQHTDMTGGEAECSEQIGGMFTAWDGYISGTNLSIVPYSEIRQAWRTTEFDEEDKDSELIIHFQDNDKGCELKLTHENIPNDQPDYEQGWKEHYFNPMRDYFKNG